MFGLNVDYSSVASTSRFLEGLAGAFADFEESEVAQAADIMAIALQREAPGSLGDKVQVEISGGRAQFRYPAYAVFVERGTRPHMIFPVQAQALHFFVKSGAEVFAASVSHPGSRPNPFIARASADAGPHIQQLFGERVRSRVRAGLT